MNPSSIKRRQFLAGMAAGAAFPGREGEKLVKENLDFLLRYWKKDNYFAKPEVTLQ